MIFMVEYEHRYDVANSGFEKRFVAEDTEGARAQAMRLLKGKLGKYYIIKTITQEEGYVWREH
jgi:hypothetical protein